MQTETVTLDRIVLDAGTQMREQVNEAVIVTTSRRSTRSRRSA